jgi:lipoprotein-anchoring transpeptidase ErfK/SrfK
MFTGTPSTGDVMQKTALAAALIAGLTFSALPATAEPLALVQPQFRAPSIFETVVRERPYEAIQEETDAVEIPAHLRRQVVSYPTSERPGTIIVDTPNTYLYYVLGNGRAMRYGIGVGREGFTWSGVKAVERKAEWPDWTPPSEMIARQPYLPRWMAGGPSNPLGARAMYIGGTIYRIHGTNQPSSIGKQVSSGCIRMLNEDVTDLYSRVNVGTKVVVLPGSPSQMARRAAPQRAAARGVERVSFSTLSAN